MYCEENTFFHRILPYNNIQKRFRRCSFLLRESRKKPTLTLLPRIWLLVKKTLKIRLNIHDRQGKPFWLKVPVMLSRVFSKKGKGHTTFALLYWLHKVSFLKEFWNGFTWTQIDCGFIPLLVFDNAKHYLASARW